MSENPFEKDQTGRDRRGTQRSSGSGNPFTQPRSADGPPSSKNEGQNPFEKDQRGHSLEQGSEEIIDTCSVVLLREEGQQTYEEYQHSRRRNKWKKNLRNLGIGAIIGAALLVPDHLWLGGTGRAIVRSPVASTEGFVPPDNLSQAAEYVFDEDRIREGITNGVKQAVEKVLEGERPLQDLRYLRSGEQMSEDGVKKVVTHLPITYLAPDGSVMGTYYPSLWEQNADIPDSLRTIIKVSEGSPNANNMSAAEVLAKMAYRRVRYGIVSGLSPLDDQTADILTGGQSGTTPLHPDIQGLSMTEHEYNEAIKAYNRGLVPEDVNLSKPQVDNKLKQKFESFILGRTLAARQGEEVLNFYMTNLDMGTYRGVPIYGLEAASKVFLGKPTQALGEGEQYILAAIVPQAQHIISQCQDESSCNILYTRPDGLKDQAKGKVDNMVTKGRLSAEDAIRIKQQLDAYVFGPLQLPQEYGDDWISAYDEQTQQFIYLGKNVSLPTLAKYAQITEQGFVLNINQVKSMLDVDRVDKEPVLPYDGHLAKFIESGLQRVPGGGFFSPDLYKNLAGVIPGEPAYFPETRGGHAGLGVVVTDGTKTLGEYDRSSGRELMEGPFLPGSTAKPMWYAYAFSRGLLQPGQMVDDTSGRYGIGDPNFAVRNAIRDIGPMTVEESLGNSRNVPIQKVINEYLKENGTSGWQDIQDFFGKFGLSITDQFGNPIEDPYTQTATLAPMGTGPGAYINDIGVFTRAFVVFADPDTKRYDLTKEEREAIRYVGSVLSSQGYNRHTQDVNVWSSRSKALLTGENGTYDTIIKTGTVVEGQENNKVISTLTVAAIRDPDTGKVYTVGVHVADVGEDGRYEDISAYNPDSSANALPTALSIAIEAFSWDETSRSSVDIPTPEQASELLQSPEGMQQLRTILSIPPQQLTPEDRDKMHTLARYINEHVLFSQSQADQQEISGNMRPAAEGNTGYTQRPKGFAGKGSTRGRWG